MGGHKEKTLIDTAVFLGETVEDSLGKLQEVHRVAQHAVRCDDRPAMTGEGPGEEGGAPPEPLVAVTDGQDRIACRMGRLGRDGVRPGLAAAFTVTEVPGDESLGP